MTKQKCAKCIFLDAPRGVTPVANHVSEEFQQNLEDGLKFILHSPFTIINNARVFATAAHGATGQKRKYTGEPYIHHPLSVASLVFMATGDVVTTAAALLHDVVEDTRITLPGIRSEFGDDIAGLVGSLTDVSRPDDRNRAARKAIDRAHIAQADPRAKSIKLADLIDNTSTIVAYDREFAKVYLAEKALLLKVLEDGNRTLLAMAKKTLKNGLEALSRPIEGHAHE